MKRYLVYSFIMLFLLCGCKRKETNGRYSKTTTDGITMAIDYTGYYKLTTSLDELDEAYVRVYSNTFQYVDSTSIYIDGNLIENITSLPWEYVFQTGMLNEGDHEFTLFHTNDNITDILTARFYTNSNRGVINIFFPSN